uniref:HTH marR-type domain-containing protein n=1 Tax=Tolypothrix bouteillei VB521301 TaxID=1479485 RepID=A0A0C1N5C0_9CYAN
MDWAKVSRFTMPSESAGYLLWQVTHLWQRRVDAVLAELDITHLQFVVLVGIGWLTSKDDLLTQVQLAEFCKIDVMQISQVARRLEVKGLVTRSPHPTDTRAKMLMLTNSGQTILEQALPLIEHLDAEFFSCCNHAVLLAELKNLHLNCV